jgi:hypothetical protein
VIEPEPELRRPARSIGAGFAVAFPTEVVMLASLSSALRLALVLCLGVGFVAYEGRGRVAYADDDEDDDGGDDGDKGDKGDDGDGEDGEGDEDDKDQPPMTAGGLYTMKTFPVRELFRPLTITQNITQVRLGIGTDVSNVGAFESVGLNLEALHGYKDNVMIVGGLTSSYNFKQFAVYGGFEGALIYDMIDFRLAARLSRPAGPGAMAGEYVAGKIKGSIDIGFPLRYVAKPEIAIVALQNVMSIDFDSKPDLNPSLGISTNPITPLSVVIFATLIITDFNFDKTITVPATARVQFSPNQKFDIGAEFTFLNVKPPEGQKFYDNRFLTLFVASRFGK